MSQRVAGDFQPLAGHVTTYLHAYCLVLFSSTVMVRIRFRVWLVSGYSHVFVPLSVVIERYPIFVWKLSVRFLVTHRMRILLFRCVLPYVDIMQI